MNVYLVIVSDRHTDLDISVYADREAALAAAKKLYEEHRDTGDDADYTAECFPLWLDYFEFWAAYSCEGDHVRVQAREVIA